MNHKASTTCTNGHSVEFGECQNEVSKMFGGTKICGSKAYKELSKEEVRCVGCKIIIQAKACPVCNAAIPVSTFQKKGLWAKLG